MTPVPNMTVPANVRLPSRYCVALSLFIAMNPPVVYKFHLDPFYVRIRLKSPWTLIYRENLRSRKALLTTESELKAIAAPAIIGLSRMPKKG